MENRSHKITYQVFSPMSHDYTRGLMRSSLEEHVKYCLRGAILTERGERPLHPDMGSRLRGLLFRPLTVSTKSEIKEQVRVAVESAESRIDNLDIEVSHDATDRSQLHILLKYQIKETKKNDQLRLALVP